MNADRAKADDLQDIINQKMISLMREMEDAGWRADEVVIAIETVIRQRWIERSEALREARAATPDNFVSDGNEG